MPLVEDEFLYLENEQSRFFPNQKRDTDFLMSLSFTFPTPIRLIHIPAMKNENQTLTLHFPS